MHEKINMLDWNLSVAEISDAKYPIDIIGIFTFTRSLALITVWEKEGSIGNIALATNDALCK